MGKSPEKSIDGYRFGGFDSPRYTPTPDQLFDELLAPGLLTEAELRVLLYIIRRTFGWKKDCDQISLSQITGGIVRRDGARLDWGAGVSKSTAVRAIKGLVEKGVILATHNYREDGGSDTTTYGLRMKETDRFALPSAPNRERSGDGRNGGDSGKGGRGEADELSHAVDPRADASTTWGFYGETRGGFTMKHGGSSNRTGGRSAVEPGAVSRQDPQKTSVQKTSKQEVDDSNRPGQRKKTKPVEIRNTTPPAAPPTLYSAYIAAVATDFSTELDDQAHVVSNVSQALRQWQEAGVGDQEFVELMYEAKRRTRAYQGKHGVRGISNKMGYLFTVLREVIRERTAQETPEE